MECLREFLIEALRNGNSESVAEFFESDRKKIFFGQGFQAFICHDMCNRLGIGIEAFLGSRESARSSLLPAQIPFFLASQFPKDKMGEYDVLIAVNEKSNDEIRRQLEECGFEHIYYSGNWNETNAEYRTSFLECFLRQEMGEAYNKEDEIISWNGFKIWSAKNQPKEYSSMLMGDFFDIIAPSVFHNYEYVREGAYELGEVCIEKDDIVLDLGANIGMFSCVAAAKGKEAYAFEPTPGTKKLLDQQKKLYDNLFPQEYAVSNEVGTCTFSINAITEEDVNTGGNTMLPGRLDGKEGIQQIEVKTMTIDAFVKEKGLSSVDFIKADIEGAERYMLMGAQETLKKFAPKLSLCTYHLPDDKEVMTELILKANPNYQISYNPFKLWAYVPDRKENGGTLGQ